MTTTAVPPVTTDGPHVPDITVKLTGDLDIASVLGLAEQLDDALALHPTRLVLDLTGCGHLDAQVLRLLIDTHRSLWDTGGRLVLAGCSPKHRRLLAFAGIDNVFLFEPPAARDASACST